jgi:hypothetical protein
MAKGGSRFGAGRPSYKATAESLQRVDVRLWAQRGYFADDNERHFSWSWTRGGEPSGSINVHATRSRVELTYRISTNGGEWQNRSDQVEMSQTTCRFGGMRNWFQCPCCGRRCELLYLRFARFACRTCNRVSYASQSGGHYDRLLHKLHKLQKRIDCGRPKGTHLRTWEGLLDRAFDLEETVDSLLSARITHLYRAAGFDPKVAPYKSL